MPFQLWKQPGIPGCFCAARGGVPRAGPQQVLKLQHPADEMPLEVVVQVSPHTTSSTLSW
jgi:hypothetical protein